MKQTIDFTDKSRFLFQGQLPFFGFYVTESDSENYTEAVGDSEVAVLGNVQ